MREVAVEKRGYISDVSARSEWCDKRTHDSYCEWHREQRLLQRMSPERAYRDNISSLQPRLLSVLSSRTTLDAYHL